MGAAAEEDLPTRFGRYEVITKVASGGMAEVYAGRIIGESGFAKLVAIKAMRPELVDEERYVSMFLDEARVAAHISSPHVVSILDLGRDDRGLPYLAMELVIGASLSQLGRATPGPWPPGLALELVSQAASGLHDAHEARDSLGTPLEIVHRDVSPQNILVGMDGRARITDFGVARAVMRITKTRTGEVKGKVRYFSPEQAIGAIADRRSDIFSLGIVAWELLTGLQLFRGRSLLDVHQAVLTQDIEPPERHRPELPPAVGAAVLRALARKPEDRYASADAFARELRKAAAVSDIDLASTSQIVRFVEERAATTVDRLTRSIRESATPSGHGVDDAPEEDPTTLDPLPKRTSGPPAVFTKPDMASSAQPMAIEPLDRTTPSLWRRWWNAFLGWLGLR
jgi:serine/threonine protein kinase